jgi:hypothetical protein
LSSQNDCLFCRLYKEGEHVREADGFVAIEDINPGDDYSPWLVDAPVGELVRVRAGAVSEEGILAA